jgi:hypothetical protein
MADGTHKAPTEGRVTHKSLNMAFCAAQADFAAVEKNAKNPHLKTEYARLDSVLEAIRPALNRHGIALMQPPRTEDGWMHVDTILIHAETGEKMQCSYPVSSLPQPHQALGAALTYARRYSILGFMGIFPEDVEDDDGHAAAPSGARGAQGPAKSSHQAKQDGDHRWADEAIARLRTPGDADDLRQSDRWQALPQKWRDAYADKIEAKLEKLSEPDPEEEAGADIALEWLAKLSACKTGDDVDAWSAGVTALLGKLTEGQRSTLRNALKAKRAALTA